MTTPDADLSADIAAATSLSALCNALNAYGDARRADPGIPPLASILDRGVLPRFGGSHPVYTDRLVSWDAGRVLTEVNGRYVIESRAEHFGHDVAA